MGKVDDNKRIKENKLFNTAFQLFSTKGINDTAINDIVNAAGVGKGTFYLYFKDKYDIRDKLIIKKTSQLFHNAITEFLKHDIKNFDNQVIFIADYIINELNKDKLLLKMISKKLSWGVYKKVLNTTNKHLLFNYYDIFMEASRKQNIRFKNPDVLLFSIIEMVNSAAYSCILFNEPISIDEFKPHLYDNIRALIEASKEIT